MWIHMCAHTCSDTVHNHYLESLLLTAENMGGNEDEESTGTVIILSPVMIQFIC